METNEIKLNPYRIKWAIIQPLSGIVPLADQKKIEGTRYAKFYRGEKVHYKYFTSKEEAAAYMQNLRGRLSKGYKVTMCTDKQFGMIKWPEILPPFTNKQNVEAFYI